MKNSLFSIIIPTFNSEKYITETLDSINNQSLKDFEILICDDGSTDKTLDIIKAHPIFSSTKILFSNRSGGPAQPRNIALTEATGQWICLIDSDDIWLPNKLATVHEYTQDSDILFHQMGIIDGENRPLGKLRGYRYENPSAEDLLIIGNYIATSSVCLRREKIQNKLFFDTSASLRGVEDFDFWIRLAANQFRFKFINQKLGLYREHNAGISKSPQQLRNIKKVYLNHLASCASKSTRRKAIGTLFYILGLQSSGLQNKKIPSRYFINALKFGQLPIKAKSLIRLLTIFFK